ncbi:hypothetical protein K2Z83_21075 [Oscillochloris sp. ZM17-4]|uniref:hypothetical protein n=1 Tax=Oscillochloris sp. ZM17-4 TaxID=2866714 RepID=UPI001C73CCA6|nr:hypothetical protein [Oscillochloris sp. ZM17-4]MBX0330165.1 hypothetical protein [Oscillochloris sp. ZM17-4]
MIVSWICIKSGKSILAAVLVHFLINIAQETFAVAQTTKCIQTLVLAVVAIGIVAYDNELFRSKAHLNMRDRIERALRQGFRLLNRLMVLL